ncbi:MAG: deoxyribonuclease V [Acidobacteriota bacterium]|nr:deoxyribonuclease V [Acidobacteriota bacterium]
MKPVIRTRWDMTPREAIRWQETMRDSVVEEDRFGEVRTVAGADLAFNPETEIAFAAVIVYRFPSLEEIERKMARCRLRFPYIPGLLSFRESPVLLAAFAKLETSPDLIMIDGHGRAHPRLFGIACHIGILFDKPVIGCGKSLLVGEHDELGLQAGSTAPLIFKGERVGMALRTRDGVKPIYVTVGNRVSLETAVRFVTQCTDGTRIPKPTREADHYVRILREASQRRGIAKSCYSGSS